jgi:hypothetical protein
MEITNEQNKRVFKHIVCPCGGKYFSQNITNHRRSQRHKAFVDNIPIERPCKNFQLKKELLDEETNEKRKKYINERYNRLYKKKNHTTLLPEIPV